jgi:Na+/melibiose symporter-like transporter
MSTKKDREQKDKHLKIMIAAFGGLIVGYYILNEVATWEKPPLGNTFHIILGCIIIAVSAIAIIFSIKERYFPKKKKKKSRPIFLDDMENKKHGEHKSPENNHRRDRRNPTDK